MKFVQALVLSVMHSFFAELFVVIFNIIQTQDILAAFAVTSYLLYINTIWSLMFILVLGGGRRTSIKVFVAPFFSSIITVFTLWLIGVETMVEVIDFVSLYLILVFAGIVAVAMLYSYRRSYND